MMKIYATHRFADLVICLGYKGDLIREYFLSYETRNCNFTGAFEGLANRAD
jgi:glucose-1-phosphate cytidylyltransferase